MRTIEADPVLSEEQIRQLHGKFIDESYLKYPVINNDTIVKNEKGETLLVFLKNVIPQNIAFEAYKSFRKATYLSNKIHQ